ncbi:hypothetical protein JX265_013937 [Neoarthrinium moseri]|uniref:Nucleoside phosphorylase domain-containing protein n=1 Tax=Neoarthrinium moseri TaxID=1658444 RepID=A0A9P9W7Q5_9PEZI|nr:hypothetical protein JX265_013937 [Neoarthrinium moseri]
MAAQSRMHDDYTIGWVCALSEERTAATAMLDERHPDLLRRPNDANTYTLGSIGGHNVVIACLPEGAIGTTSAATVAKDMVHVFPAIRVGLMVGIGGGVPPTVRLGDVVVSVPDAQYPGVVQWDMGKAEQGGKFRRTGALNKPPALLLTAVTKLKTDHKLEGSKIAQYLEEAQARYPRSTAKFLRSNLLQDVLFKASYQHVHQQDRDAAEDEEGEGSEEEESDDEAKDACKHCDKAQIVKRKPRDMRVHCGLIVSGNQVIKDARVRDRLSKDLGKVLCIEMEAAGLMDNFPCIVIRGICDYADSHKNTAWQEHAAAIAAAFAKELLGYVVVDEVKAEKPVRDILLDISRTVTSIQEETTRNTHLLHKKQDMELLDWLSTDHYGAQQSDTLKRWHPKTGLWFLRSPEYQDWLQSEGGILYCPGIPGAGKTIMASAAIHDIDRAFPTDANIGLAYVYFIFSRQREQTAEHVLASLLTQFLRGQDSLPEDTRDLFERHRKKGTRLTHGELLTALSRAVSRYERAFVALDALDECTIESQCRTKILSDILDIQAKSNMNILATSRMHDDIAGLLTRQNTTTLSIIAQDEDMVSVLRSRIKTYDQKLYDDDFCNLLVSKIVRVAEGMRLLSSAEMLHALAIHPNTTAIDTNYCPSINMIMSICAGLVIVDEESHTVRLVHYTTQEYFDKTRATWFTDAQERITESCVTYLSYEIFDGYCETDEDFEKRLVTYPFYSYASHEWSHHAGAASGRQVIVDFLKNERRVQASSQALLSKKWWSGDSGYSQRIPKGTTGLHLASRFGLTDATPGLCTIDDVDKSDSYGQTPLSWAAECGHAEVVKLLLETKKVEVNSKDNDGRTPLSWAAKYGHAQVVKLLLETKQVEVDSKDNNGQTPLSWAAECGHAEVVKLLLETKEVEVNSKDNDGRTPLSWAAEYGHAQVVKLLLKAKEVEVNSKDNDGQTPLSWAAECGHAEVVKLLLETKEVEVNSKDDNGWTALSRAAKNGHAEVVKMLLKTKQVEIDAKDTVHGRTPLSFAAENGHVEVVKLLLETEPAEIDAKDTGYSQTPLSLAAEKGHPKVVKALLEAQRADSRCKNTGFGQTPLSWAARNGHVRVVKLLLGTKQVDVNSKDMVFGQTPLSWAARNGNIDVLRVLLETEEVDSNSQDTVYGRTPLSWAARNGHANVVELLIETKQVDVNSKDMVFGQTPLSWAARKGYAEVVKVLLRAKQVRIDSKDYDGHTPLSLATKNGYRMVCVVLQGFDKADSSMKRPNPWEDFGSGSHGERTR